MPPPSTLRPLGTESNFQKNTRLSIGIRKSKTANFYWFSDLYIQEVKAQRFKALFCFEIICLRCVPSSACANDGLTEKEMIKPNGLLVSLS
jgi:hypothetical protein